ncbi:MAG: high frequency lysogenization protein HflD [Acidobacteriia bacterium]|nr:high frequency lysogenization protein HflD [Terriglobia bacterium]
MHADYLAQLLHQPQLSAGWLLVGIAVAFWLGAMHALEPGHGKTIVAAYLVGSRGNMKHAALLGATVTFTHTISVFLLGLGTLLLSSYIVPEKIIPVLGVLSGISIVLIGGWLFYQRWKSFLHARAHALGLDHHHHDHGHHHHHHHDHDHHHHHDHDHAHGHSHTHDGHTHSHVPQGDITFGSLIALGASGGLVPCPAAMVLLLSAIAIGRIGLGLVLLLSFSLGLAGVLMAIGMLVIHAKNWLPESAKSAQHPLLRFAPVVSALVILCVGILMTAASLRWIPLPFLAG